MAEIKEAQLIRDELGSPVPQYWDETSQMYIARTVDGSFADVDFSKVRLIRDKLGSPIPQLWDTETARFVPGKGGANGEVTIESVPGLRSELDQTTATLADTVEEVEVTKEAALFMDEGNVQVADNISMANWQTLVTTYNGIVKKTNATDTMPHLAFPTVEVFGGKLYVAFREGADHVSFDGKIILAKSEDSGVTWTFETLLSEPGKDYRDPSLFIAPNGNMVMKYFDRIESPPSDILMVRFKIFDGVSWGAEIDSPRPTDFVNGNIATRGNATIVGNKILVANYTVGVPNRVFIVESSDSGATWNYVGYVASGYNEASVCYQNGKVYIVMRGAKYEASPYFDYRNRITVATSLDGGVSWSPLKELPIYGHAPSLIALNGRMIMTYRGTNKWVNKNQKNEVSLVILRDIAVDSPIVNILWSTGETDMGYCDIKIVGTEAYLVYYLKNVDKSFTIHFKKMTTSYLNGLNILSSTGALVASDPIILGNSIYKTAAGTISTITDIKLLMGEIFVTGDGTDKKNFSITLDKSYTVYQVNFTVKSSSGAFIVNVDTISANTITGVLKVITSTFSSSIIVYWQAIVK